MENNKKDFTIEELEKQYAEVGEQYKTLGEQIKQKKQEKEDKRKAQLTLEKEARKKEVDEAYENYLKLVCAYISDYGVYVRETDTIDGLIDSICNKKSWWCF